MASREAIRTDALEDLDDDDEEEDVIAWRGVAAITVERRSTLPLLPLLQDNDVKVLNDLLTSKWAEVLGEELQRGAGRHSPPELDLTADLTRVEEGSKHGIMSVRGGRCRCLLPGLNVSIAFGRPSDGDSQMCGLTNK